MDTETRTKPASVPEAQIADLLQDQYTRGQVYLQPGRNARLYSLALEHGYVDPRGYLTRKGRALMTRYQYS